MRIIATKKDLESERVVHQNEGEDLAKYEQMIDFFETSAKDNVNVDSAFMNLAKELKARYSTGNTLEDSDDPANTYRLHLGTTTTNIGGRWRKCCNF